MAEGSALRNLRVIDLTDDTGRFATKLLTEAGADVLRIGHGLPGVAMKGQAGEHGGLLDWWYDGGKQRLALDLDSLEGQRQFKDLAARADLLIETEPPGRLARLGLDFPDLHILNPRLVHVSLTPFGRQGPRAHWQISDLVAAALSGVLSVTGTPDAPLNGWGRQCFNTASFFAAICGLAGVYAARETSRGQHIDLSLQQSVLACTEQVLMFWFFQKMFPVAVAPRQASLHWSGAFKVVPCASGHVMVTPGTHMPTLVNWLDADGMAGDLKELDLTDTLKVFPHLPHIMELLQAWAATKDAGELFLAAQQRHLPFGEVLSVAEVAHNPHLQKRSFFRPVNWSGPEVKLPGPLFRLLGSPAPSLLPPATTSVAATLQRWTPRLTKPPAASPSRKPLAGIRVLDFSWVLAGPYCTRILADLGADVIKIQTESRSQGANSNAFPYFVMWNRNKRSISLDMKHPKAGEIFRRLVEWADVVVENFSVGVLERWGIGYEAARQWNDRIVYLSMSGVGQDGPWRDFVTYAPTIHALCGLTHLTNPPGRKDIGMGFALTDHTSGLAGALAVLEALEARRRTGHGQRIDLSQLEVGTYLLGPAYVDFLNNGREAHPQGNQDAFTDYVPNNVYRCLNDEWLAITARNDQEWQHLCKTIDAHDLARDGRLASAEGRRSHRSQVDEALGTWAAQQEAEQAMRQLQAAGVPAGKVQNMRDCTDRDEQLAARQWLVEVENKLFGLHQLDSFPAIFSETPLGPYAPAPFFGEHNFEVYKELLGMSDEEIAAAIGEGLFA
jgi:crotonobetainyl-CoA:carnitine CoA-transferase CaiB-like acyl-CoA transferase